MKNYFLLMLAFLSFKSFAQDDFVKRNAVFFTFDEFRNNAPSIYPSTIVAEESESKTKWKYTDSIGQLKRMKDNFWGFSDSEYVYIIHKGNYGRFIEIGRLCMFTYHFVKVSRDISFPNATTGAPTSMKRKEEGNKTYVLFLDTGEIIELLPKNMKTILASDPELLKQYQAEELPDQEKRNYVWKYNELHPLYY